MSKKKIVLFALTFSLIAESFLFYIIYFNPHRITALIDPGLQMWLSGGLNFLSACCLLIAFIAIRKRNIKSHIIFIHLALFMSLLFLINYIFYHLTIGHTVFKSPDFRFYYLFILITHLSASVITLPLIVMTYSLAIFKEYVWHKKIAPVTFCFWMYVSVSGVLLTLFLKFLHQA